MLACGISVLSKSAPGLGSPPPRLHQQRTRLWSHCRSYYNRANVELYMEEYQAALDDLRHAHKLDRALPAEQRIELITK